MIVFGNFSEFQGYLVNWEIERQVWDYMFCKEGFTVNLDILIILSDVKIAFLWSSKFYGLLWTVVDL